MLAILERQVHRTAEPVRFVSGENHFERGAAVVDAAARLAVLFDGFDQVLDDEHVAHVQAAVLERLRLADAGAGDRDPRFASAARRPRRVFAESDGRQAAGREVDDALRAKDLQAESAAGTGLWFHRREVSSRAAGHALTGGHDKTVRLWETFTGKQLASFRHEAPLHSVSFSPDGRFAVSGSQDHTARVWQLPCADQEAQRTFSHRHAVFSASFSPDGRSVLTSSRDGTARLWDVQTKERVHEVEHKGEYIRSQFSRDGSRFLIAGGRTVTVCSTASGKVVREFTHPDDVLWATFHPTDSKLATACVDGTVALWDIPSGKSLTNMKHDGPVPHLAFSPDGNRLLSGSDDDAARLWDSESGNLLATLPHKGNVGAIAWSRDGSLVATGSEDATARVWNATTGEPITEPLKHDGRLSSLSFNPDGKTLLTGSGDKSARIWDIALSMLVRSFQHRDAVNAVAFASDGQLIVTGDGLGRVQLWHVATGRPIGPIVKHAWGVNAIEFSPDGRRVLTAASDNAARMWQVPEPVDGEPATVRRWIEVATGTEIDANGVIRQLDADTIQQRARILNSRTGGRLR